MTDTTRPAPSIDPLALAVSRRRFLRGTVFAGGGLAAAAVAACTPSASFAPWTYGPPPTAGGSGASAGASVAPTASMENGAGSSASPGASHDPNDHDANALAVVQRFLGGESAAMEGSGNQPYDEPRLDGDTKVFDLTIDMIQHRIDAQKEPLDALG
ncbi:MAG TPA: hypothetical protein VMQ65_11515, partial [Candidatus Limnocylindria bacterium]|nr:hypothetical protein [Candidatus Limnocylindria bacterium]